MKGDFAILLLSTSAAYRRMILLEAIVHASLAEPVTQAI
jgi:hypothetical protein